jgi:hypothetical protein
LQLCCQSAIARLSPCVRGEPAQSFRFLGARSEAAASDSGQPEVGLIHWLSPRLRKTPDASEAHPLRCAVAPEACVWCLDGVRSWRLVLWAVARTQDFCARSTAVPELRWVTARVGSGIRNVSTGQRA